MTPQEETRSGADPTQLSTPSLGMKAQSVRSGVVVSLSRAGGQVIRLAAMLVLARTLTPADFGLFAMVLSTIGIANIFKDLGLSAATVQRASITQAEVSALFWINAGVGAGLTLLTAFAAPFVAALFDHPEAAPVTMALSLSYTITALGAQHQALMTRGMRFKELSKINVASALAANVLAVLLALRGHGYWALAISALFGDLVGTALSWAYSGWRPQRPGFRVAIRDMMSFGGHLAAFNVLGYIANNLQNVLIGYRWGATDAGHYSRAYFLIQLPLVYVTDPLSSVAVPALTRLKDDARQFREYYLMCVRVTLMAAAPVAVGCALFAPQIVEIVLGPQWTRTTLLFQLLTASLILQPIGHSSGWLYLSRGDTRRMLRWGLMGWSAVIVGILAGLPFGLEGVALAHSATLMLLIGPCMQMAFKGTGILMADFVGACWRPIAAAAVAILPVLAVDTALETPAAWIRLSVGGAIFAASYLLMLSEVLRQRALIVDILRQLRSAKGVR